MIGMPVARNQLRLLLIFCLFLFIFGFLGFASGSIITVDPLLGNIHSIQEAVNKAQSGDTIIVHSGLYYEHVRVQVPLVIKKDDSDVSPPSIIGQSSGSAITFLADGITLIGFTLTNCGSYPGVAINSNSNTIINNQISGCSQGLLLNNVEENTISNNDIFGNSASGITLIGSNRNTITYNTISNNRDEGILIDDGSNANKIYLNNFLNDRNANVGSTTTIWSTPDVISYQFGGSSHTNYLGNYWSDYDGIDANRDGLGDSPYLILEKKKGSPAAKQSTQLVGRRDLYPLIERWETFFVSPRPTTPSPTPPPTTLVTITPSISGTTSSGSNVTDGKPPGLINLISRFPLLSFLGVIVIAALLLSAVRIRDTEVPYYLKEGSQRFTSALMFTLSILGCSLLLFPYFLLNSTFQSTPLIGKLVLLSLLFSGSMVYLALSSFTIAYEMQKKAFIPLVTRIQVISAAISLILLVILLVFSQATERFYLALGAVPIFCSLFFALWQHFKQGRYDEMSRDQIRGIDARTQITSIPLYDESSAIHPIPDAQSKYFPVELQERYTEIEYVGKGGIARVFKARKKADGKVVAVKIPVSFDEVTGKSFMKEMRVWEELHHPNIVDVSAVNILPIPFVEMEFFDSSLDRVHKPMELASALKIIYGISEGLKFAHSKGVIHRDLKPHNIMLSVDTIPKIADWGMSGVLSDNVASTLTGFSIPYAAPEQLSPNQFGGTDQRTDIFQLGTIAYELLTGKNPFEREGIFETSSAILSEIPIPPKEINVQLTGISQVILRCLEKSPSNRYQSIDDFQKDFLPFLNTSQNERS